MVREVEDEDFNLLRYWKDMATSKLDENGGILQETRLGTLSVFARLSHGVDCDKPPRKSKPPPT